MAQISVGLGSSPELFTQPSASCERADCPRFLIREPIISKIGDAADIAYASHRKTGGSTVSIFDGNLVGKKLYALSIFPGRTVELLGPPTRRQLFVFALENSEHLLRKNCALGTWYHRSRRVHVLDVVVCISNLPAALELAKCFDQESIYSLEQRQEIAVPYHKVVSVDSFVEGGNG
jgi:hypothetical protein